MIAHSTLAETVSVIIPCYNAAPFVGEAIRSALAQDWPHVEIIVVDDASTDGSREVIERYRPRIQAVRLAENGGAAHARNRGVELSRGGWLMFLDADDRLSPDALRWMMEAGRREPGAVVHCGWRYLVREAEAWVPRVPSRRAPTGDALRGWLEGGFIPACSLLWPRALYAATDGWDPSPTRNDDGGPAMRALAAGARLARADGGEALYRRRGGARPPMRADTGGRADSGSGMRALDTVSYVLYTHDEPDARPCGGRMRTPAPGVEAMERIAARGRGIAGAEVAR